VDRAPAGAGAEVTELPQGEQKHHAVHQMFDAIAPRYDLLNTLMTFGLDRFWRRSAVGLLGLAPGAVVLDLGAGTGALGPELEHFGLRGLGVDLSYPMLAAGLGHGAPALQGDAAQLPLCSGALDGVVSGFALRNFADLPAAFSEMARVLRPAGRLAILEVDTPSSRLLQLGHRLWFRHVVPRLGALLSDAAAYAYLPRSVAYLPAFDELRRGLEDAGFTGLEQHRLSGGITQVITATRLGSYGIMEAAR
jgi:demethylmenaquinone methyltransferase/2-methoxy-6-polyprenyl-1,4-benzoquinol methylase